MIRLLLAACFGLATCLPAAAQNPFSAAVTVNDRAVTFWELEQRARFLQLLDAPGDLLETARRTLIEERLQVDAAERLGVVASAEELEDGMEEFAGRANLSADAFISQIESRGVAAETFRDFVFAGITWRNVLRAQFGSRAQVTEEEVDRALALAAIEGGAQILIAEIVVPLNAQNQEEARQLMTQLAQTTNGSVDAFSAAARQYSAAQSAETGGALGYRPLASLPPALQSLILPLPPGGVTDPVPLGQAIAIFQLRDFREEGFVTPEATAVEYAIVPFAGGLTEANLAQARELEDSLDTCDDLFGVLPGGFERVVSEVDAVPAAIAAELVALDDNEISYDLTTEDGALMFLMLCGRTTELPEGARETVRQALFNQRLESYADGFLAELMSEAIISEAE
ncbi:MAG: peptidylprolyl isomerase [Pseudomonadota bacterium]